MATIAVIPIEIKKKLEQFRASSAPLILCVDRKVNPPALKIDENVFDDDDEFSIEELASRLPDAPRYIVLSYKPDSANFPKVILIDWIPSGCETAASMLHVGTLPVVERLTRNPKVIQVNDGEDGLTREILDSKLRR